MRAPKMLTTKTIHPHVVLTLLISSFMLTACGSLSKKVTLNETPTRVDASFGKSVQRMIDIQKRPAPKHTMSAGNQLDGWEAERINSLLDSYE